MNISKRDFAALPVDIRRTLLMSDLMARAREYLATYEDGTNQIVLTKINEAIMSCVEHEVDEDGKLVEIHEDTKLDSGRGTVVVDPDGVGVCDSAGRIRPDGS